MQGSVRAATKILPNDSSSFTWGTLLGLWLQGQYLRRDWPMTIGNAVSDNIAGDRLPEPPGQRLHHQELHQPDKVGGGIPFHTRQF